MKNFQSSKKYSVKYPKYCISFIKMLICFFIVCVSLPRSLVPFGKNLDSKCTIYFEWPYEKKNLPLPSLILASVRFLTPRKWPSNHRLAILFRWIMDEFTSSAALECSVIAINTWNKEIKTPEIEIENQFNLKITSWIFLLVLGSFWNEMASYFQNNHGHTWIQ